MKAAWVQLVLGAWILLSPWVLGFSDITVMKWGDALVGSVILLINIWAIFVPNHNHS